MIRDSLRFSLISISRNKIRTMLTGLCISIGVISILSIWIITAAGKSAIDNELDSMGINGISIIANNGDLTNDDLNTVRLQKGVSDAIPVVIDTGKIITEKSSIYALSWGIDAGAKTVISLEIIQGRDINEADVINQERVCVIDITSAYDIFGKRNVIGEKIELCVSGEYDIFKIIGVADTKSCLLKYATGEYLPAMVYLPYTTLQQYVGNTNLDQIAVKFYDSNDLNREAKKVLTAVSNSCYDNEVNYSYQDLATQRVKLSSTMDMVTVILTAVGGISLLVAAIGSMTIMLVSVNERTKEIGIKKSLGASRMQIILDYLCEAALLFTAGAFVGIAFTVIMLMAVNAVLNISLEIQISQIISVLGINVAAGCLFGIFPAIKASRLNPVDALRNQ